MSDLAQDYIERHGHKKEPRSLIEDKRFLSKIILPALGKKKVIRVTRRDIETIHLNLHKTPTHANRALSVLSKMFNLAIGWGWRTDNPVKGIERYPEHKREEWIQKEELQKLWDVLDNHPNNKRAYAIKLLILTGARSGEVFKATWAQFDLDNRVWLKPYGSTKQRKFQHLPISEKTTDALKELKKLNKSNSEYLFPRKIDGKPIATLVYFWKKALKEAGLPYFRVHDLRHTHASHLVSSGVSLSIVGKLLGHTQASTTQRYAHLADEPQRLAAELFGSKFDNKKVMNDA